MRPEIYRTKYDDVSEGSIITIFTPLLSLKSTLIEDLIKVAVKHCHWGYIFHHRVPYNSSFSLDLWHEILNKRVALFMNGLG